jgi:small subunit ribosomal protein S7
MPRKGPVPKRKLLPDPRYRSLLIAETINRIMLKVKKSVAEMIVYGALEEVAQKTGKTPAEILETAIDRCKPLLEVRPRRIGGATYQIPIEVAPARGKSLGLKWLVNAARTRSGKTMRERLASEVSEALQGLGGAVKKKEESHKMAEANKAFASYRW